MKEKNMLNFEKNLVEKIRKYPVTWLFLIVSTLGSIGVTGLFFIEFSSIFYYRKICGLFLILISFLGMWLTLRFYIKHNIANY